MSVPHLWCGRQWVGILVPAPAENLYQSSVKFLSHFRSPRPKSLCRSESFRNLYCLHSEGAKNENVLEYSRIWLYERRNVLISHKRWRKRGHGHQNNFWGVGVGRIWKKMGPYFLQIQNRSKPRTDDVLKYLNIQDPSKHSCTWWYQESKVLYFLSYFL